MREDHSDSERVLELLRQAKRELAGVQSVRLQVQSRIAGASIRPARRPLPWAVTAAAVLLAVGVAAWMRLRPAATPSHPGPVADRAFVVVDGEAVLRGTELETTDRPATLTLGDYCHIQLASHSRLKIAGEVRAEAVLLREGSVICDVAPRVGSFEVQTETGNVRAVGTRFSVAVGDSIPFLRFCEDAVPLTHAASFPLCREDVVPITACQGDMLMTTGRLLVAVVSGAVLVAGSWGDTPVAAGEKKSFVGGGGGGGGGGESVGGQVNVPPDLWRVAGERLKFGKFMRCLAVANLLPDFALDKEQKTNVARISAGISKEWDDVAEKIRAGGTGASSQHAVPEAKQYVAKIKAVLSPAQRKILDMPYAVADPALLSRAQRRLSPAQVKALDEFVDPFDPPDGDQIDLVKFSGLLCDTAILNLSPDFTLEKAQKTQIQEIWHNWKAALDKYQDSVKDRIQAIYKEHGMMQLNNNDTKSVQAFVAGQDKIHKILAAGPKSGDSVAKLRAVFTPEQLKAIDANRAVPEGVKGTGSVKFNKVPQ